MGRKSQQQRTTLIVLAAVGVAVLVTCFAGVGVVLFTVLLPAKTAAKTYERDELRNLLMGKTEAEVIKAIGKPDRTADDRADWTYYDLTYDKVSGNRDGITSVEFSNGRVVRVHSF